MTSLAVIDGPYGLHKYVGDEIRTVPTQHLYQQVLQTAVRRCDHIVVFGTFESLAWIHETCLPSGIEVRSCVVWHKPDSTAGGRRTFAPRHELFLHLARPTALFEVDAIRVPYGDRALAGVRMKGGKEVGWQPHPLGARCGNVVSFVSDRLQNKIAGRTAANKHACVKPKPLLELLVRAMTTADGYVDEPFVGTTNLKEVVEAHGRTYYGFPDAQAYSEVRT